MKRQTPYPIAPRLDIACGGVTQPHLLTIGEFDLRFRRQNEGDSVLDVENIIDRTVVTLSPNVRAVFRINQLRGDADAGARLAHAAFENVAHAELLGRLAHVDRASLENETRIACDHPKARKALPAW